MNRTPLFPIAAVSRMTGLGLDTIRAWERRYGAVVAARGAKGRVYTDAQVERLRRLAALVEQGHAISEVAGLSDSRLVQLLRKTTESAEPAAPSPGQQAAIDVAALGPARAIVECIEGYDYAGADREVGRLAAVMTPRDLVYRVGLPVMREVGERWHQGRLSVAQEHMASAIVQSVMGTLVRLQPARPHSPRLLFASPEGELHEFGLRAAAMLAAAIGLEIVYLGTSLPAEEIASAASRTGAAAVVLALTGGSRQVLSRVPQVRQALPRDVELWVGGSAAATLPTIAGRVLVLPTFEEFEREASRLSLAVAGTQRGER